MLTKDVIVKYHKLVPFPWTPRKLKKAEYDPTKLLLEVGRDLERCEDKHTPEGKAILDILKELELLSS